MAMSALVLLRKVVDSNYFGFLNLLMNPLYWQSLVGIGEIACATLAWSYRGLILKYSCITRRQDTSTIKVVFVVVFSLNGFRFIFQDFWMA